MKGISAVIAVVLILMITVALAAMAYVWFTDVFGSITESAGEAATKTGETIGTQFSIATAGEDVTTSTALIYITNTGSSDIAVENFNVFINNKLGTNATAIGSQTLSPSKTVTFGITNISVADGIVCGAPVLVTYGSLEQVSTIQC